MGVVSGLYGVTTTPRRAGDGDVWSVVKNTSLLFRSRSGETSSRTGIAPPSAGGSIRYGWRTRTHLHSARTLRKPLARNPCWRICTDHTAERAGGIGG
jgi:hypothetical protein